MSDALDPDVKQNEDVNRASDMDELDQADNVVAVEELETADALPTEKTDTGTETPPSPDRV